MPSDGRLSEQMGEAMQGPEKRNLAALKGLQGHSKCNNHVSIPSFGIVS